MHTTSAMPANTRERESLHILRGSSHHISPWETMAMDTAAIGQAVVMIAAASIEARRDNVHNGD